MGEPGEHLCGTLVRVFSARRGQGDRREGRRLGMRTDPATARRGCTCPDRIGRTVTSGRCHRTPPPSSPARSAPPAGSPVDGTRTSIRWQSSPATRWASRTQGSRRGAPSTALRTSSPGPTGRPGRRPATRPPDQGLWAVRDLCSELCRGPPKPPSARTTRGRPAGVVRAGASPPARPPGGRRGRWPG